MGNVYQEIYEREKKRKEENEKTDVRKNMSYKSGNNFYAQFGEREQECVESGETGFSRKQNTFSPSYAVKQTSRGNASNVSANKNAKETKLAQKSSNTVKSNINNYSNPYATMNDNDRTARTDYITGEQKKLKNDMALKRMLRDNSLNQIDYNKYNDELSEVEKQYNKYNTELTELKNPAKTYKEATKRNYEAAKKDSRTSEMAMSRQLYGGTLDTEKLTGSVSDYTKAKENEKKAMLEKKKPEYVDKYESVVKNDSFTGQFGANLDMGRLGQDENAAWNDYLNNPNENTRSYAQTISNLKNTYIENNKESLDDENVKSGWITKSAAQYLPQLKDQAIAGGKGAIAGGAVGSIVPVLGTAEGAKAGYIMAQGNYSYEQMRGAAFKSLIDMGVEEETARAAANNEAVVSSIIEMLDAGVDIATLGGGRVLNSLVQKGVIKGSSLTVAKEAAKKANKSLAKYGINWGLNILSEGAEEWSQEAVSMANEERVLQGDTEGGVFDLAKDTISLIPNMSQEQGQRALEAGYEGVKIAAMFGGAAKVGNTAINAGINTYVGNDVKAKGNVEATIEAGLDTDEGTKANKKANQLLEKYVNDEKISSYALGSLNRDNNAETISKLTSIIEKEHTDMLEGENIEVQIRLLDRGLSEVETEVTAPIIRRAIEGDVLSDSEARTIAESSQALDLFREATGINPQGDLKEQIRDIRGFSESVVKGETRPVYYYNSQVADTQTYADNDENTAIFENNYAEEANIPVAEKTMRDEVKTGQIGIDTALKDTKSELGESGTKAFNKNYTNFTKAEDIHAFKSYYQAGLTSMPPNKLNIQSGLSDGVKYAAYAAGQNDGKAGLNVKTVINRESGFSESSLKERVSSRYFDKKTSNFINNISKATGVKTRIDNSNSIFNAYIDNTTGELVISAKAENPAMQVVIHEITHRLEKAAPKEWNEYRNYVINTIAQKDNIAYEAVVKNKIKEYSNAGIELDYDGATREILAEWSEKILKDKETINTIAAENSSLGHKILAAIKNLIKKIKTALNGDKQSEIGGLSLKELYRAEQLWINALRAGKENVGNGENLLQGEKVNDAINEDVKEKRQYTEVHRSTKNNTKVINTGDSLLKNDENKKLQYSLKLDKYGNQYWKVETEDDIFKDITETKVLRKLAFDYILGGFSTEDVKGLIDGKELQFRRISAKEYVYGRQAQTLDKNDYNKKMRIAPSILDLIGNADTNWFATDMKNHKMFPDGFENYKGRVGIDNIIFEYVVRVGKNKDSRIFYDVNLNVDKKVSIKKEADIKVPGDKSRLSYNMPTPDTNVSQKDNGVNMNKSNILYIDPNKNRTDNWFEGTRLYLPVAIKQYGSIQNISYANDDVNIPRLQNIDKNNNSQFSLKKPMEEANGLIALHNIDSEKLSEILDLGGMVMPSIAITRSDMVYDNFGEISLVFKKDTIDPQNKGNKVYSGDASTVTFPLGGYKGKSLNDIFNMMMAERDKRKNEAFRGELENIEPALTRQYNSISEIKKHDNRIRNTDINAYQKRYDRLRYRIWNMLRDISANGSYEDAGYALYEAAKTKLLIDDIKAVFNKYGFEVTAEQIEEIQKIFRTADRLPKQYFEAKPERIIGFDEVKAVIVPNTLEKGLIKELKEKDIAVIEYEAEDNEARKAAVNSVKDVQFSIKKKDGTTIIYNKEAYEKQIDDVLSNKRNYGSSHIYMGDTPDILEKLGLRQLPMLTTIEHIYTMGKSEAEAKAEGRYDKNRNYHKLGDKLIKKIPEALKKPVMIIKSNTALNDARIVLITDLKDNNGNLIFAAIKPEGLGRIDNEFIETNIILSAYGRESNNYVTNAFKEGRILYLNKEKSQRLPVNSGVQFPSIVTNGDFTYNLSNYKQIVKTSILQKDNKYTSKEETESDRQFSLKMGGYMPEINITTEDAEKLYGIKNINRKYDVINKISAKLKFISKGDIKKPIKNIDTGMEIEIFKNGIGETFGNDKYYMDLSKEMKLAKIASMEHLAKLIKYGEVRSEEAPNYHNLNSKIKFAYLKADIKVNGRDYIVNMDIRKSPNNENRFYLHSLKIKEDDTFASIQKKDAVNEVSSSNNKVSQSDNNVNNSILQKDNKYTSDFNASLKNSHTEAEYQKLVKRNSFLREQIRLTKGIKFNMSDVESYAKELTKEYSTTVDQKKTTQQLYSLYSDIANRNDMTYEEIYYATKDIAREIISNSTEVNDDIYNQYKHLRKNIRTTALKLSEQDRAGIGDYNSFRKANMGKIKITNDGISVDTFYEELCQGYSEFFTDDVTHPADQLLRIADVYDQLLPVEENPYAPYMDRAVEDLTASILNKMADIPEAKPTFADKADAELKEVKTKNRERLKELRSKRNDTITEIKTSYRQRIKELRDYKNMRIDELEGEIQEQKNEKKRILKEAEVINKKISSILNIAQTFKDWTKEQRKPSSMLSHPMLDMYIKELSKIKSRGDIRKAGTRKIIAALDKFYTEEILGEDYFNADIRSDINGIMVKMNTVGENNKPLSVDELAAVEKIMKGIRHLYVTYDSIELNGKRQKIYDVATEASKVLKASNSNSRKYGLNWLTNKSNSFKNGLNSIVEPSVVFGMLEGYNENGFLQRSFQDIRDGETKSIALSINMMKDINSYVRENKGKYNKRLYKGRVNFKGNEITINQAVEIYLLSQRKQAQTALYYEYGGVSLKDSKDRIIDIKGISENDIQALYQQFTEEDKRFIDLAKVFFNEKAREVKAEADLDIIGYTNVGDSLDYIPIRRAGDTIPKSFSDVRSLMADVANVYNFSFNKKLQEKVLKQMQVTGIYELMDRHAKQVGIYASLTKPLQNFDRVLNRNIAPLDGNGKALGTENLRGQLTRIWGGSEKYISKFLQDVQGRGNKESSKAVNFIRSGFVKAQLGMNVKVILAQTASYPMAFTYLSAESLGKGLLMKPDFEAMDRYSGWAMARNYESGIIRAEGMINEIGKKTNIFTKPIQKTDRLTIGEIWNACQAEAEIKYNLKMKTEENYIKAAELLEKVGRGTQPNYTNAERSALMRGNEFVKTFTMFTSVPLKQFSRVIEAWSREAAYKETANKKWATQADIDRFKAAKRQAVKTQVALLGANAMYVAVGMAVQEMLKRPGSEDDDDLWEKFYKGMTSAYMNMIPILRDVTNALLNGYDVENYFYGSINDMVKGMQSLWNWQEDPKKAINDSLMPISVMTGMPLRNIKNLFLGLAARAANGISGTYGEYQVLKLNYDINKESNYSKFYDQLYKASKSNQAEYDLIYDDMIRNGIKSSSIERSMSSRKKEDIYSTDMASKAAIKMAKGEFTSRDRSELKRELRKMGYEDKLVESAINKMENESKEEVTKEEFERAYKDYAAGKINWSEYNKIYKKFEDSGYSEEDIKEIIRVNSGKKKGA